jgi:uncharacterized protein (TIGR03435 family)
LRFDVASVKRYGGDVGFQTLGGAPRILPGGVLRATSAPVLALIKFAYRTSVKAIAGGPDWIGRDMFVIEGRTSANTSTDQMQQMLQTLLEERFALRMHREQRELPFFALTLARSDGRLGPYLVPASEGCDTDVRNELFTKMPQRPRPGNGINAEVCGTMDAVRNMVELALDGLVVDKTGLTGQFAFHVFAPSDPGVPASASANFPEALREQTGLKVERTRGLVDVWVIDSVKQPDSN